MGVKSEVRMDPDGQKYISKYQEAFNGLLKLYIGHTENGWLAVSKIGLVIWNIQKYRS